MPYNTEKIRIVCKSEHTFNCENQAILLMITDGKKIALSCCEKIVSFTSNHDGHFYCLNCFHSYSIEQKLTKHEKVCNDHDYCYVESLMKTTIY